MQNMKTTTMTWHTFTALIRSFLPMSRKNIITIMTRKGSTIATAMNLSAHEAPANTLITIAAFALLCLLTYVLFVYGKTLVRLLGQSAMNVMTRMMGLILAVIGAQMLIAGVQGAFPGLK